MSTTPPEEGSVETEDRVANTVDRYVYWFTRHWLAALNVVVAVYVGLPLLAPMLMAAGATQPASVIYRMYSPLCHQMASRSVFFNGEQSFYPREIANSTFEPIEAYWDRIPELEGIEEGDWLNFTLAARRFLGNSEMGYKTALCARDLGIYIGVLGFGLLYGLLRRRFDVPALSFVLFVVIGVLPIALDGFSQLFGYWVTPIDGSAAQGLQATIQQIFPLRESSPLLRTVTGLLFGFTLAWMAYPRIGEGMAVNQKFLARKLGYKAPDTVEN